MNAHEIKEILFCCVLLNYVVLFTWFAGFVLAHDWVYRLHRCWFKISVETFDAIQLAAITAYKIAIVLLNLVPLIAICFTT
jgi:hypothetical protein